MTHKKDPPGDLTPYDLAVYGYSHKYDPIRLKQGKREAYPSHESGELRAAPLPSAGDSGTLSPLMTQQLVQEYVGVQIE